MIRPGLISARDADEINEALRFVRGLRNLTVVPPLRKIPGPDGQNIITLDTSNFLRVTIPTNSGAISGSGSSTDLGPSIVLGTVVTGQECVDGIMMVTTMDLVSNDGYLGFENETTAAAGCCDCPTCCPESPTIASVVRLLITEKTGWASLLPAYIDVTMSSTTVGVGGSNGSTNYVDSNARTWNASIQADACLSSGTWKVWIFIAPPSFYVDGTCETFQSGSPASGWAYDLVNLPCYYVKTLICNQDLTFASPDVVGTTTVYGNGNPGPGDATYKITASIP